MSELTILPAEETAAPTREEWLGQRRTGLGGSDIAAILGISGSPFAVWCSKTQPQREDEALPAKRLFWGKALERAIAAGYSDLIHEPIEFLGEVVMRHPEHQWWIGSPDGRLLNRPVGIEIKNRGLDQRYRFGREGTDEIPEEIACQVLHYMPLLSWPSTGRIGADYFDVVVLFGGNDHVLYRVHRDADLEAVIAEKGEAFWRKHVETGVPPEIDGSDAAAWYVRKRFPRNVEAIRQPTDEEAALLESYATARHAAEDADAEKERLENLVKLAIGNAEGLALGKKAVTWKKRKDTEKTDLGEVLAGLRGSLTPDQLAALDELTRKHTRTSEGIRVFYWPRSA